MERSHLIEYIQRFVSIPESEKEKVLPLIVNKSFTKGDNFLRAGSLSVSLGFIRKGLFRYYYINKKGIEYTKGFFPENSLLISYSAIIENRPSYFYIQALEDAELEVVNYQRMTELMKGHPCWPSFTIAMLQQGFLTKEKRERDLLLLDAEERYRNFLNDMPGLETRVPQHMIASYLGILPESLSRIRKKMVT